MRTEMIDIFNDVDRADSMATVPAADMVLQSLRKIDQLDCSTTCPFGTAYIRKPTNLGQHNVSCKANFDSEDNRAFANEINVVDTCLQLCAALQTMI